MNSLSPKDQSMVPQLLEAARLMQMPSIPRQQLLQAEEIFKNFRRTEKPYALCRHILENNLDQVMLYQTACTLKDALIREWKYLPENQLVDLRNFLLQYVVARTEHEVLMYPVREKLVQVIAVMVKREAIDDTGEKKTAFFEKLRQMATRGEPAAKIVAGSLTCSLLQEFAIITKSSDFGLPFASHFKAKRMFEVQDLLNVFKYVIGTLGEMQHVPPPYSDYQESLCDLFLQAAESILSWTFVSLFCIPRRIQSSFESDSLGTFRPPPVWKDVLLKPDLLQLFFNMYFRVNPRYPELRHRVSTCLYQLSSLNRFLTSDETGSLQYLTYFVQGWLYLTSNPSGISSSEALSLSNIVRRLTLFFSPVTFLRLPEEIREPFFERLSELTQAMALKACQEDAVGDEETKYMDSLEYMLQTWLAILLDPGNFPMATLAQYCGPSFDAYVLCHLGPPQGKRLMRDEEEIAEVEDSDREKYKDQLGALGVIGRAFPGHALPLLVNCIEDRLPVLQSFICAPGGDSASIPPVTTQMTSLFEDLHWLLLIAGTILLTSTDDNELDMHVPMEIMEYSVAHGRSADTSPLFPVPFSERFRGLAVAEHPGIGNSSDPLVRLLLDGIALSEILRNAEMAGRSCILSPELMSTTYWFLERFSKAYLVLAESMYSAEMSLALLRAFGMDTDGALWTIKFLFQSACSSLNSWISEESVLLSVTSLLTTLARDRKKRVFFLPSPLVFSVRCRVLLTIVRPLFFPLPSCYRDRGRIMATLPEFWSLVEMQSTQQFRQLPSRCVRGMMTFFVSTAAVSADRPAHEEAVRKCLWYVAEQFSILSREDLSRMESNDVARAHLLFLIDLLIGAANGGLMNTSEFIFSLIVPSLRIITGRILVVFNNDSPTVDAILELMNAVGLTLVSFLSKASTEELFSLSLETISNYAKFNVGKRTRQSISSEDDDSFHDIMLLIELLSNLLSRDYLDLSPEVLMGVTAAPAPGVSAAQVSLEGMNLLMPLMTHDLLRIPQLCKAFYRLLAFISVISADTFASLTPDRQGMFYNVVVTGLTAFDAEVTKNCLDITAVLGLQVIDSPSSSLRAMMSGFVKVLLEVALGETLRSDNIPAFAASLFTLMCAYPDVYKQQVENIVAKLKAEDEDRGTRLECAFVDLTRDVRPSYMNSERTKFMNNFEKFAIEAQAVFLTM